jgi:multiple sugar transport system permease protein
MTTETPSTRTLITPTGRRGSVQPYRPQSRSRWGSALRHALMIVVVVISLYPVLWMVVSSLRPEGEIFGNPSLILTSFEWENYAHGWTALGTPFGTYLLNSGIIVLGSIVGNLFSCSLAAYAFARLRFRFQRPAFAYMLVTLMLPIHVVMVQFIRGLPKELDEAARIDGAGHGRIFFQILLPLMTPALATTTIFTFIWVWNDFFSQLIFLTSPSNYTVPIALRSFIDAQSTSSFGAMFAMSVVSIIPLVLIFGFGQKFLIKGIATTGLK